MKKLGSLALSVVTSVGGFVEVGSISTSAQAGAEFGFALLWSIALATVVIAVLIEMAGRVAILSRTTIAAAVRERFGIHFQLVPLLSELAIDLLLLTAEICGTGIAVKLVTGIGFQWWVVPVSVLAWLVLWKASFSVVEDGMGLLGMVTLSFVVAAWQLHPDGHAVARGFLPSLPNHDLTRYGFLAVSILGATVSPYLLNFYASGAIEDQWNDSDLVPNKINAALGLGFGGVVSMGVLVTAAMVLGPQRILVDSYEQAALMMVPVFGRWGVMLFAMSLGIGCFGAAMELALNTGYLVAQVAGCPWGLNKERRRTARFAVAFTVMIVAAAIVGLLGIDPLKLTLISVALTVVIMPLVVLPFLVLVNDREYVKEHTSGALGNGVLAVLVIAGAVLALIVIPLEILGG